MGAVLVRHVRGVPSMYIHIRPLSSYQSFIRRCTISLLRSLPAQGRACCMCCLVNKEGAIASKSVLKLDGERGTTRAALLRLRILHDAE